MELKKYQQRTLNILEEFLTAAREVGARKAFEEFRQAEGYEGIYQPLFGAVPYICLRLPTGGGKTLLGTHAIKLAAEKFLEREYPFVLWLVPTKEIRQQTLKVLRDPKNFYWDVLSRAFGGNVNIFEVTDFRDLRLHDLISSLNICVATFQSFRVANREGRKVWQGDEALSSCFARIPQQNFPHTDEHGRHNSFGNLISFLRPLMIIDEAHNNSTNLSFEVMQDLNPAAVIELTATPARNSNVLVKVTAVELKNEDMIKLPVILGEVSHSPEKTLDFAIHKRKELERLSAAEEDYLRPIVLYQAESKNRDYTVDYVRNYLIKEAKIPAQEVAVATGERHELDGIDLTSTRCPIRHIITVQALKEGWDCPFASVFCSLSNMHSSKDAEQLLGRVLRMPKARRRKSPALNQAYAFVRVSSWEEALKKIRDNLLNLGFEAKETDDALQRQPQLIKRTLEIETSEPPDLDGLSYCLREKISVEKADEVWHVKCEEMDDADITELEAERNKIFKRVENRDKLLRAIYFDDAAQKKNPSPAERGEKFSIPQLCLNFGEETVVAGHEYFLDENWTLTDTNDYDLPLSHYDPDVRFFEFNLRGEKLKHKMLGDEEQELFSGETNLTQSQLIGQLSKKVGNNFVKPEDFAEFTRRALNKLMREKNFSLEELVRQKFLIANRLEEKIKQLIDTGRKRGFRTKLFGGKNFVRVEKDIAITFDPNNYPAKKFYTGAAEFGKHYYREVGDMNSEEVSCAQCIDSNPQVATWIRNIDSEPKYSFWLPLHKGKFYPDFVVKLKDETFAAVEYKGKQLKENPNEQEKKLIGELWAERSGGLCKFLMAVERDEHGRNLSAQMREFFWRSDYECTERDKKFHEQSRQD